MDAIAETSGMDTVQDTNQAVDGGNLVTEERSNESTPAATAPKAHSAAQNKTEAKSETKPAAKTAAGAGVGSSAGAKTKTVESEQPDPVNRMRRNMIWTSVGGFLAVCFMMFLRFFLPRTIF